MAGLVIFIVLIVICVLALLGFFLDDIIDHFRRKHHPKIVYDLVSSCADENDQLLLNDVVLMMNTSTGERINYSHILFGSKYVYLIDTFSGKGGVYGNAVDKTLFLKDFKGNVREIRNPIQVALKKMDIFQERMGINPRQRISVAVVVYNDSLIVPNGIAMKRQDVWFIPASELIPTIKQAEQANASDIKEMTANLLKKVKNESDYNKRELKRLGLK